MGLEREALPSLHPFSPYGPPHSIRVSSSTWLELSSLPCGGSPLPYGGFPSPSMGFIQRCCALFPSLRGDMTATTPPVPNPTLSLPPSPTPPLVNAMVVLIEDPFIPPQHHGFFFTGPRSDHYPLVPSPTTISASAPAEQRPPPEPPPQVMWQTPKETLGLQLSSSQRQSEFAPPLSVLGPERPP